MLSERTGENLPVVILGNGLVGSAIAHELALSGDSPTIVTRTSRSGDQLLNETGVRLVPGSSASYWSKVKMAVGRASSLISAIGVASPALVESNPDKYLSEARELISHLTTAAESNAGLNLYVVTSGGTVYGETPESGADEAAGRSPISKYGQLNKMIEDALLSSSAGREGRVCLLRLSNPYGLSSVGMQSRSFVDAAVRTAIAGSVLNVFGDGSQIRDFIHVDDAARLITRGLGSVGALPPAMNVGTGVGHSLNDVTRIVEVLVGHQIPLQFAPAREFDVHINVLDSHLAIKKSGTTPRTLESGIQLELGR
jgi:UDP-glucose 4-epimerase